MQWNDFIEAILKKAMKPINGQTQNQCSENQGQDELVTLKRFHHPIQKRSGERVPPVQCIFPQSRRIS